MNWGESFNNSIFKGYIIDLTNHLKGRRHMKGTDCMKEKIVYPVLFFLVGVAYLFVLPAFTAPDERDHFVTAYYHVNNLMGYQQNLVSETEGGANYAIPMRDSDFEYCVYNNAVKSYANVGDFKSNGLTNIYTGKVMPYPVALYLPAILGILISRVLDLGTYFMIVFARLLNFLAGWLLSVWAVRMLKKKNLNQPATLIAVMSMMPITLHLMASYSSDSIVLGCGFALFSYLLMYHLKDKKMSVSDMIVITVLISIFSASKPIYMACLFFALLFPKRCFTNILEKIVMIAVPIVVWIIYYGNTFIRTISGGAVSAYAGTHVQGYTMGVVLSHPIAVVKLILTSMVKQLPYIVAQKFGLYLGALDIRIPTICVLFGMIVFALVWVDGLNKNELVLPSLSLIKVMVMFLLVYGCCYGMELFWWTTLTDTLIGGIQGRYFLPLFPMFVFAIQSLLAGKLVEKNWINKAAFYIEKGKAFIYPVLALINIAALASVYKMFSI